MQRLISPVRNRFRFAATLVLFCAVIPVMGCGRGFEVAEVTGVVTMDGKPMDMINVEFWSSSGPQSIGKTDSEGKFELVIYDQSKLKGAAVGDHKVSLRDAWPTKDDYMNDGGEWVDMSDGKKSRINTKYFDAMSSPLTAKVESGKKNFFEFKVDAAPK